MRKTISLAAIGALLGAAATALGMACFAIFESSNNPALSWSELFATHALHVALLFLPSYVLLAYGFSRWVMRPIRHLEGELYRLGTGHLGPVALGSRVRELQALERGVNVMAQRMAQRLQSEHSPHSDAIGAELAALRAVAAEVEKRAPLVAAEILRRVKNLQLEVAALGEPSPKDAPPVIPQVSPASRAGAARH